VRNITSACDSDVGRLRLGKVGRGKIRRCLQNSKYISTNNEHSKTTSKELFGKMLCLRFFEFLDEHAFYLLGVRVSQLGLVEYLPVQVLISVHNLLEGLSFQFVNLTSLQSDDISNAFLLRYQQSNFAEIITVDQVTNLKQSSQVPVSTLTKPALLCLKAKTPLRSQTTESTYHLLQYQP
jgi:hypothetical protein